MSRGISAPRFDECLASFLGDLRAWVFSSQSKAARYFGLSHTTISRYESGLLMPPPGYVIHLAQLCEKRLADSGEDMERYRTGLLQEVNQALQWCYPDHDLFQDWAEISRASHGLTRGKIAARGETSLHAYWGEAPDVTLFFGRQAELTQLERWIVVDRCRLVAVLGLGGAGKTFLVTAAARQTAHYFDWVIWRSLRNAPPLEETIRLCLQILSGKAAEGEIQSSIPALLSHLRQQRGLLILDNLEAILDSGDRNGYYRPGYQAYGEFFESVALTEHLGCLLLTSREKPAELDFLPDPGGKVRMLPLEGIGLAEGKQLLQPYNLVGAELEWQTLVRRYSGNPLALKLVADTIRQVFDCQIGEFLKTGGLISPGIRQLLDEQFERATPLERESLYWLAVERKPIILDELYRNMLQPRTYAALAQALLALRRRSLIEKNGYRFTLQNVVMEYVSNQFVSQTCPELIAEQFGLIQRVAWLKAEAEDHVRESQARLILDPIAEKLTDRLGAAGLETKLLGLLARLKSQTPRQPGYAGGNLLNLMLHLGYDLRGADFSGLSVWQAFLRETNLPDIDFREADLSKSAFANLLAGVNDMVLSPDGRYLAIATGRSVQVWQAVDRELHTILEGHTEPVWTVAFAPDGYTLFSGSSDHTVRVWDFHQGRVKKMLPHESWVWSVSISPDGRIAASAGENGAIYLWNAQTGERLNEFCGHAGAVRCLAFSPDSQMLASGGRDQTIRFWNVHNGAQLHILEEVEGEVLSMSFDPDGDWLLSGGSEQNIRVWDWHAGEVRHVLRGHTRAVASIAVNLDGDLAASGGYDGAIRLWDLDTGQEIRCLEAHTQAVKAVAFDATGSVLISGGYDQTVRFWEARSGLPLHTIRGYSFQIKALAFSPGGEYLASCSSDYVARLWNTHSGELAHTLRGHNRWVAAAAFSPDGTMLASGSYDRTARLWQVQTGRLRHILEAQNWVWCTAFSPDGSTLAAAGADATIWLWEAATGQLRIKLPGHQGGVGCLAFNPTRPLLASGGEDHAVRLWNLETGEMLRVLCGHQAPVSCVVFSADGLRLVSVSKDQVCCCWDVACGAIERNWQGSTGPRQVALSPAGRLMASGGEDGSIHLTDLTTGKRLKTLTGCQQAISALAFDSQGEVLASGCLNGSIQLWHLGSGQCLRTLAVNRPYEGMEISGATGISEGQKAMLRELGAVETRPEA